MSDPNVYVVRARDWARCLTARENRGYGDFLPAMRRLARRIGLRSWRDLWTLHYRPPNRIFADIYEPLRLAYEAECERQERLGDEAKARAIRTWGTTGDNQDRRNALARENASILAVEPD